MKENKSRKVKTIKGLKMSGRILALCFMLCAFSFSFCSSSSVDENENSSEESWYVTISGKVGFPQKGTILIQEVKNGSFGWQDSISLSDNYTFEKKIKISEPGYYKLNFYNRQIVDFILFKNDVEINVDGNDPSGFVEIEGSPEIDLIRKVQSLSRELERSPEVAQLNDAFVQAQKERNQDKMLELQGKYQDLAKKQQGKIAELIKTQPPSLAVINLLQNNALDRDQHFDVYLVVAEKLRTEWPDYAVSKIFVDMVDKMKTIAIGQPAPEISLPNPQGEVVKLSSMKGKYVLVDFWAKWCGPCRQENPNVVRVYNKYKEKGFTVFGVSLDRKKEDWLKAIEEDNLTWTHVSDLKYWQSEAAKTYNINAIPFSLLLDPNGIIIAKNLRGAALEKKLAEVFNQESD